MTLALYRLLARACARLGDWATVRARAQLPPSPALPVVALDLDRLPAGAYVVLPLADAASYAHASRAREALRLLGRQGEGSA